LEIVEAIDGPVDQYGRGGVVGMTASNAATVEKVFAAVTSAARKRLATVTLANLKAARRREEKNLSSRFLGPSILYSDIAKTPMRVAA
jgi:hypothetical protein